MAVAAAVLAVVGALELFSDEQEKIKSQIEESNFWLNLNSKNYDKQVADLARIGKLEEDSLATTIALRREQGAGAAPFCLFGLLRSA